MKNRHEQNIAHLNRLLTVQDGFANPLDGAGAETRLSSGAYVDEVAKHLSRIQRQSAASLRRI